MPRRTITAALLAAAAVACSADPGRSAESTLRIATTPSVGAAVQPEPVAKTSALIYESEFCIVPKRGVDVRPARPVPRPAKPAAAPDPPPELPPALLHVARKWRTRLHQPSQQQPIQQQLSQQAPAAPEGDSPDAAVKTETVAAVPAEISGLAPVTPTGPEPEPIVAVPARLPMPGPLTGVGTSIALPEGKTPPNVAAVRNATVAATIDPRLDGSWSESGHSWAATGLCHRPLYYEEVNLERYGYQHGPLIQPFVSGTMFFVNTLALPYKIALHRPCECTYTLGHYRPGTRAPWRWHRTPLRAPASVVEAGVVVGLVFLIP